MARAENKSILATLTLTTSKKNAAVDKTEFRRSNLLKKLNEQELLAEAMLKGDGFFGEKYIRSVDEDGEVTKTLVKKRINKWFFENNGEWFLEIKYGNKTLQLVNDKTAILVGKLENLKIVIGKVKQAVIAKELDFAIVDVLKAKK